MQAIAIRPNERRDTLGAFATLLAATAGHAVLETARDALFLERIPAARLPWLYLAIALTALTALRLQRGLRLPGAGRTRLSVALLVAAGCTLGVWWVVRTGEVWALYALYLWTGVVGTLVLVRFWGLVEELFTVTQARRLFTVIGAGSVLGAILGSALARLIAGRMPVADLLPSAAALFLAAALAPWLMAPREEPQASGLYVPGRAPLWAGIAEIWGVAYLRRLGALVLISSFALTLVDYLFKSAVAAVIPGPELATFFADVYLALNALAFLVQVLVSGWLLRVHGVSRALAFLPVALLAGATGIAFGGGIAAALLLKAADGGLRHSLHRTAIEVLYVPLAQGSRVRLKGLMDVLGQRGGQALASALILGTLWLGAPPAVLGAILVALVVAWALLADSIQGHYLELFRRTLRDNLGRGRELDHGLDLAALESLISALSSQDESVVIAALDQLERRAKVRLIPLLILYHPSRRVILRALRIFIEGNREDVDPLARRLLGHEDPEVRAAALRFLATRGDASPTLRSALADPSPLVRATAGVGLAASASADDPGAIAAVLAMARSGDAPDRQAIAQALEHHPLAVFVEVLLVLGKDPLPEIQLPAARAMGALPDPRLLAVLFPMLAHRDLRATVRRALAAQSEAAIEMGGRWLADAEIPGRVRRQIPRALRHLEPGEKVAELLLSRYLDEADGALRHKILRSLGSMRRLDRGLALDAGKLRQALARSLSATYRLLNWRLDLERGAREVEQRRTLTHKMIVTLLLDEERHSVEHVFRLLGLQFPGEDFRAMYRGIEASEAAAQASALELLQNLLEPPVREAVVGLLDPGDPILRLSAARPFHEPANALYSYVLHQMLRQGGPALSALAVAHVGELGFREMRGELRRLEAGAPPLLGVVLERALAALNLPPQEPLVHGG